MWNHETSLSGPCAAAVDPAQGADLRRRGSRGAKRPVPSSMSRPERRSAGAALSEAFLDAQASLQRRRRATQLAGDRSP